MLNNTKNAAIAVPTPTSNSKYQDNTTAQKITQYSVRTLTTAEIKNSHFQQQQRE
jgi:hypothetical protein